MNNTIANDSQLQQSSHPALMFLKALDPRPEATFNIETYTDAPKGAKKPKHDPLSRQYENLTHTAVAKLIPELEQRNSQGAGIFIAVNEFNGKRRKENIRRIRTVHADLDSVTPEQAMRIAECLAPSIVVQSSPGHFHMYWLLEPNEAIDIETTEGINSSLANMGADKATTDAARLLRLPGFRHMKYRADGQMPMVKFKHTGSGYMVSQLAVAFPPILKSTQAAQREAGSQPVIAVEKALSAERVVLIERIAGEVKQNHPRLWSGNCLEADNDPTNLSALAGKNYANRTEVDFALLGATCREAQHQGVANDDLPETLWAVYSRSGIYKGDINKTDRKRKIVNHAIPKIVLEASQSPLVPHSAGHQLIGHAFNSNEVGDILAGRVFAKEMRNRLLYVGQKGHWRRWDGLRWSDCGAGEQMAAAKEVAGKILDCAVNQFKNAPDHSKRVMAFATSLQTLKRLEAMIELAKSEPGMSISQTAQLDGDPWLLGVGNGVVNLKDGGLLVPDPNMLITRQAAAEYHDDAQCPKWLEFLRQIFNGDQETIDYIQRVLGYTLTGITTEEMLFICYGYGATGKSVFGNVVSKIMADYACTAPPSLLTVRRADDAGARNDLAMLCGARLVSINELQGGDRLDEQIVKQLAGREKMSARFLHKEFFEFMPTAKPWLRTNHKPIITGEDDGIWRRLQLIPFNRKFAEHEKDNHLESKLLEERDGILAWMVRGCLEWQRIGLKPSALVRKESASYRKESDLLGEFLDDRTQTDPSQRIEQSHLYSAYRTWHDGNGTRAGSKASFSRKLKERGFGESKSNSSRYYTGLTLEAPTMP